VALLNAQCLPSQTPDHLKTPTAEEAFNPDGLAQRSIALLKDTFPDVEVRMATSDWRASDNAHELVSRWA
jgi:hypothetical protein